MHDSPVSHPTPTEGTTQGRCDLRGKWRPSHLHLGERHDKAQHENRREDDHQNRAHARIVPQQHIVSGPDGPTSGSTRAVGRPATFTGPRWTTRSDIQQQLSNSTYTIGAPGSPTSTNTPVEPDDEAD